MFLRFIIEYKRLLRKISKKYQLKCNWITQDNFYFKNYFLFSKAYTMGIKNSEVPKNLEDKIRIVNTTHKYNSKHHEEHWGNSSMSHEHLDSMLCSWVALSIMEEENREEYINRKIKKSKLNIFSKKYLENRFKNLENLGA